MDRLDRMHLFSRIVERRSFSAAAGDLGLARSTVTAAVKELEAALGVRLLERTTRHVAPTLDGRAFYERCVAILADVDEAENVFRDAQPRGLLRVDAHGYLTRTFLLPRLDAFLDRYPLLDMQIGQGDRMVDLVREGVDCVIRAGELDDSGLITRRIGSISEVTCASPAYLARHAIPISPEGLDGHQVVGFISSRTRQIMPLEFMVGGEVRYIPLPARLTVNDSDTMIDLALQGYGLVQLPRYHMQRHLDEGSLVEVLPAFPPPPTPLSILYPPSRQMAPRVRVFIDWVTAVFAEANI